MCWIFWKRRETSLLIAHRSSRRFIKRAEADFTSIILAMAVRATVLILSLIRLGLTSGQDQGNQCPVERVRHFCTSTPGPEITNRCSPYYDISLLNTCLKRGHQNAPRTCFPCCEDPGKSIQHCSGLRWVVLLVWNLVPMHNDLLVMAQNSRVGPLISMLSQRLTHVRTHLTVKVTTLYFCTTICKISICLTSTYFRMHPALQRSSRANIAHGSQHLQLAGLPGSLQTKLWLPVVHPHRPQKQMQIEADTPGWT